MVDVGIRLPPALPGERRELQSDSAGKISWYQDSPRAGEGSHVPLLLLHSINAAGSAYEVKPLYDHYRGVRPVYALEFPGFGMSGRDNRLYTPRLMTDAIHLLVEVIRRECGATPVDAIALSLASEYLARAAVEKPEVFGKLAFVSPSGVERDPRRTGLDGNTLGRPGLQRLLSQSRLGKVVFRLLTLRPVIRYFLRRTWGRRTIDPGLLNYDYLTTRPAGAEYAPLCFVAGYLCSADSGSIYRSVSQPVWVVQGVRGDLVNGTVLKIMRRDAHWAVDSLPTGALPHLERPREFIREYEYWAASQRPRRQEATMPPPSGAHSIRATGCDGEEGPGQQGRTERGWNVQEQFGRLDQDQRQIPQGLTPACDRRIAELGRHSNSRGERDEC